MRKLTTILTTATLLAFPMNALAAGRASRGYVVRTTQKVAIKVCSRGALYTSFPQIPSAVPVTATPVGTTYWSTTATCRKDHFFSLSKTKNCNIALLFDFKVIVSRRASCQ